MDTSTYGTFYRNFPKSFYVFRKPLHHICEVNIDDLLIYDEADFVFNIRTIFQKCREISANIGFDILSLICWT